jgi:hypothetical protein
VYHLLRDELARASQLAEEMLQLADIRSEVTWKVMGCRMYSSTLFDLRSSRASLEQGLAFFKPEHRPFYGSPSIQDSQVTLLTYLPQVLLYLGYPDQARTRLNDALNEAQKLSHAHTLAYALSQSCYFDWIGSSNETLAQRAKQLMALSSEQLWVLKNVFGRR